MARIERTQGPTTIRTEDGQLVVYLYIDIRDRDLGGYVREAQRVVAEKVVLPRGVHVRWSGQFEYLERAEKRLMVVIPATLLVIFLLLYLNFRRMSDTLIVIPVLFAMIHGKRLRDAA